MKLGDGRPDNLYAPVDHDGGERGHFDGRVRKSSAYTEVVLHPKRAGLIAAAISAAALGTKRVLASRNDGRRRAKRTRAD
jgi:hypothetical protein